MSFIVFLCGTKSENRDMSEVAIFNCFIRYILSSACYRHTPMTREHRHNIIISMYVCACDIFEIQFLYRQ